MYNSSLMSQPVVVPREEHTISRKQIDPDALRVLYRLHGEHFVAYLVGGSVRDLLLGRRPKDFDIGTSAHPYQVKRLFRNCWIIGRRFRLAHVRFGPKTIEVATFRRKLSPEELVSADVHANVDVAGDQAAGHVRLLHRDNTFGTPEEDAFRRDFTVNSLFYDIASRSIIDYTGGLDDLKARVIRCIGDPMERFQEDPVRMLRAVAMAARLDFAIDLPVEAAIAAHRAGIANSAPARLMDELYKLLRAGASQRAFRMLAERRLLEPIAPSVQSMCGDTLWRSLAALDVYRNRFQETPDSLTNPILLGSLVVPLGLAPSNPQTRYLEDGTRRRGPAPSLGILPMARRDVERLRHILMLQRRLVDVNASPRARRALMQRGIFQEALTWFEIHGNAPEVIENWRGFIDTARTFDGDAEVGQPFPRRHRRRRRAGRRRGHGPRRPEGH
jgi:poly(A) polymerase